MMVGEITQQCCLLFYLQCIGVAMIGEEMTQQCCCCLTQKYNTVNLEIRSSIIVQKLPFSVGMVGLDSTVIPALRTLDPLDNVTPAWLDGLEQIVSIVKDSDSAQRVTVLNVSRMDTGKEIYALTIWMFI